MQFGCQCHIIPSSVLEKLSHDTKIELNARRAFADTIELDQSLRKLRASHAALVAPTAAFAATALAATPSITVYDCGQSSSLPGTPVSNPGTSADATIKRTFAVTTDLIAFYQTVFGRNSIDGRGMTLLSSVHYGVGYNNAFWTGGQMVYGDGDGQIFLDFTASDDVLGHELTHGVTQNTAGLIYRDEPGALNESMSDVFGSMFRQWRAKQDVTKADWLIGADIMGPAAKARNYKCLRDMANPGAAHCLSPQPSHMSNYEQGGDVHTNSGIPNKAFHSIAMSLGGKSWEVAGKIWYAALTSPKAKKSMKIKAFATLTVASAQTLFPTKPTIAAQVKAGWKGVGVL
ncbi:MAG: M4 family metallopeptidase [Alphaproteobacteria bacterium]